MTGSPGCAMGGAATGDKSGRDSVDGTVKTGGGASGHDVQNTYKNTASFLAKAVFCVRLTAYYVISFLFPFVKRRYRGPIVNDSVESSLKYVRLFSSIV